MPKFNLSYHRVINTSYFYDLSLSDVQFYNPLYNELFNLDESTYNKISLNHKYQCISSKNIYNIENKEVLEKDYFIKYSPLVDPTKFMSGKYVKENIKLPSIVDTSANTMSKILNSNNASYVDNFFYYLSSQLLNHHKFKSGIDYYGSFMCNQHKFKYDISDDLEYLYSSEFFNSNLNVLFTVEDLGIEYMNFGSRANKKKLCIENTSIAIDCDELKSNNNFDLINSNDVDLESSLVFKDEKLMNKNSNNSDSDSDSSDDSEVCYSTDDENNEINNQEDNNNSDSESDSSDSSSEDTLTTDYNDDKFAFINDFPVQAICIEKCNGTLDRLFESGEITSSEGISILFQIIMTLLTYQKTFYFTHNDLHTNNIMYMNTDIPYLYYKFNKSYYKVPTYGKIFKIIDFGRSIYRFNNRIFCSDSFDHDGDASSQYNCEPFYNEKKARIDPNFSFDLCRLGCSIYDFIIDETDNEKEFNELQKIVKYWCTDDENKNILYKKNGEERYPNFKLYKMIARTVHKHTPEAQLKNSIFKKFQINKVDFDSCDLDNLIDIDNIPSYI